MTSDLDAEAVWWAQCMYCGESYHVLNGNYIPQREISACEYCTKDHGDEWTLEAFPVKWELPEAVRRHGYD